jgi:hypothetical protein
MPVLEFELLVSMKFGFGRMDLVERALSALNDRGYRMDDSTLKAVSNYAHTHRFPLIKAHVLRAARDFSAAANIWAEAGARPYEARARIELAASQGVAPDPEMVAVLRKLGDIEYLEAHQLGV